MSPQRSPEDTLQIAERALAHMRSFEIPATPENFTVWYHYAGNTYPDLKSAIDVLLKAHRLVSAASSSELFERFFANAQDNEVVRDAIGRIEDVARRTAEDLSQAGEGAAAFGDALLDASGALAENPRDAGVLHVVQGILTATRDMEAHSRDLERRLDAASNEVTQLKDDIEAMRLEATTDSLTGLCNRKKFDLCLREETEGSQMSGEPLSLLMIDLDHFKRFNDDHGHLIGDHVLRLLGDVLRQSIKGRDTAARFGGEEFVVVLPQTPLIHAKAVGNSIRERIAKKRIVNRLTGAELGSISLSVGAAQYQLGEPIQEFIARADAALYRAKNSGRNRVVSEIEGVEPEAALGR